MKVKGVVCGVWVYQAEDWRPKASCIW